MCTQTKIQSLNNALRHYCFHERYVIVTSNDNDRRKAEKFAIGEKLEGLTDEGWTQSKTQYMNYEEMNAFLRGYDLAKTLPLEKTHV